MKSKTQSFLPAGPYRRSSLLLRAVLVLLATLSLGMHGLAQAPVKDPRDCPDREIKVGDVPTLNSRITNLVGDVEIDVTCEAGPGSGGAGLGTNPMRSRPETGQVNQGGIEYMTLDDPPNNSICPPRFPGMFVHLKNNQCVMVPEIPQPPPDPLPAQECVCEVTLNPPPFQAPPSPIVWSPQIAYPGGAYMWERKVGDGTMVYHFWDTNGTRQPFIEVRHVDGAVLKYQKFVALSGVCYMHIIEGVDAYDNVTKYEYDSQHRVTAIHRPDGISELWNYDPTWVSGWSSGYSGVEVTYRDNSLGVDLQDATYFMIFKKPGNGPFLGDKLWRVYHPKTATLADLSGAPGASLFDTATAVLRHRVFEFDYFEGTSQLLIKSISQRLADGVDVNSTVSSPVTLREFTYVQAGDRMRVQTETVPATGQVYQFTYAVETLEPSRLTAMTMRELVGAGSFRTTVHTLLDDFQRPTLVAITPSDGNHNGGRPRAQDTADNGGLSEPPSIAFEYQYSTCGSCAGKPTRIKQLPSNRVTEYTYDSVTGLCTLVKDLNPSGSASPASTTYSWSPMILGDTYGTYKLDTVTTPDNKIWSYSYTLVDRPTPAGSLSRGKKVSQQVLTSPQVGSASVTTTTDYNTDAPPMTLDGYQAGLVGYVTRTVNGDGVATTFHHAPVTGFLTGTVENPDGAAERVETSFTPDRFGRPVQVVDRVGSSFSHTMTVVYNADDSIASVSGSVGGQLIETKFYYDRSGNLSVRLRRNATSAGAAPDDFGASARTDIARQWLRDEFHYSGPNLAAVLRDRRTLDRNEVGGIADVQDARFLLTNYEWSPTGKLVVEGKPNGAEVHFTYDGYGSLYKVEEQALNQAPVLHAKFFVNNALEVVRVVRGQAPTLVTSIVRNAAGVIEEVVEPSVASLGSQCR